MSLADFLGQELMASLARFDSSKFFGAWAGGNPAATRRRTRFAPVLYGEDHSHLHHEFCLLLTGRCRLSFQHRTCVLKTGDLVACAGGVPHAEVFSSGREDYRLAWWILWEKDPLLHVHRYRRRGDYDVEHVIRLNTLSADAEERLEAMRSFASGSLRQRPPIEPLREAMMSVTLELYRQVLKSGDRPVDARAELVRKVTDFVRARSSRSLTLADVAEAVHMSPNYLTSLYHSQTGVSLGRFILTERISRAMRMLRQTGSSVKSVGLELGFSDPFTFSRAFKRVAGVAPRDWVQEHARNRDEGA
jgi:AraC-like DNA-binding protein